MVNRIRIRIRSRSPSSACTSTRSRPGFSSPSASVTTLTVEGRPNIGSLHRYLSSPPSSSVRGKSLILMEVRMHLVSCGWKIKKDDNGVFYVSPENSSTRKLVDACLIQLCRNNMEEGQENEQDQPNVKSVCALCNQSSGDDLETGFCSQNCAIIFNHLEQLIWQEFQLSEDLKWSVMRTDKDLPKSEQKTVLLEAVDILCSEFHSHLMHELIFRQNFYVAAVWKENVMVTVVIFKIHANAPIVLAEMPVTVTVQKYRGNGALKVLIKQLENVLRHLKVTKMVLPSVSRTLYMWVKIFGFATIPTWDLDNFLEENKTIQNFDETVLCYKIL